MSFGARGLLLTRLDGLIARLFGRGIRVEDEFNQCTNDQAGCEMSRQVVVQEQLAAHQEEGEEVSSPGQEEESSRVIQTRSGA